MPNKMLIDATHPEETRVVVLRGNRVEEFDFESANRKQLRGNIYLAKVTRVEPSLQAAFVDYGGNRHGFLAFSEIHPDYYQIPVADRQALIAAQEQAERDAEADHERRRSRRHRGRGAQRRDEAVHSEPQHEAAPAADSAPADTGATPAENAEPDVQSAADSSTPETAVAELLAEATPQEMAHGDEREPDTTETDAEIAEGDEGPLPAPDDAAAAAGAAQPENASEENGEAHHEEAPHPDDEAVESVGGADALEEAQERAPRVRVRQYKIQEVIKRRQVMLVQVVKEERGTKGAALTTYLSLAGRYCVLMPNTARGGGISRKITSSEDRNRLKEIAQELEVPEGMGVILRTAGAARTKTEVKRDFEYLLRLWEQVRDLTLKSTAPKLVYEEGSLTKRSIRDLYNKDIDEIIVSGEQGYKDAKEFMRMLMPSHARNVKFYRDSQPIFTRFGIESQLDAMFSPTVQLRSGGYIVINQAEALVAIDVNSGRATREHHIEDTALKTNVEAAEEVARQLRLRDLAGLIVIDFIDMDEGRNNRTVERRLKEALKHDRARIQVGRISHFGLLEMSRQRIRTSVLESSTEKCPVCGGSGHVRSVGSVTLALLRSIEESLLKGATHNLIVRTRPEVALYILNHKRGHLRALEDRFQIAIIVNADATVVGTQSFVIDRGEQVHTPEAARTIAAAASEPLPPLVDEEDEVYVGEEEAEAQAAGSEGETSREMPGDEGTAAEGEFAASQEHGEGGEQQNEDGHRRRRRRRGGRGRGRGRGGEPREHRDDNAPSFTRETAAEHAVAQEDHDAGEMGTEPGDEFAPQPQGQLATEGGEPGEGGRRRRRRGRRGGRRNRHRNDENGGPRHGAQDTNFEGAYEHGGAHDEPGDNGGASAPAYPAPSPSSPMAAAPIAAPSGEPAAEPRRRSTVREAAPSGQSWAPASPSSASEPVISSSGTEEPAQPKRGWWGKRLLGGKD